MNYYIISAVNLNLVMLGGLVFMQLGIWDNDIVELTDDNQDYLTKQLITYLGNKRALLNFIGEGVEIVKRKLNKQKISSFDVFSGSGIVSRFLKKYSDLLIVNDLEKYAEIISRCYLTNKSDFDEDLYDYWFEYLSSNLEKGLREDGFINELYAPKDLNAIKEGERCFYTPRNAKYLDTALFYIQDIPEELRHFFIAPLLSEASIHANTSGVFKGFYKNSKTGRGQFGGNNRDALSRILGEIHIQKPIFSRFESLVKIYRGDSNDVVKSVEEVDVAYIDPPYNQHPYGSNYFMLNLIAEYNRPENLSLVSGIPSNWNRSLYNKQQHAYDALKELIMNIKAKFLLISFNSEGFITLENMLELLSSVGKTSVLETKYNTFRGSRNLANRDLHVKEYLYLVEKH
jgi:adenine-specific DNA-methyltransferase